mgnify:CR=1 FL=1
MGCDQFGDVYMFILAGFNPRTRVGCDLGYGRAHISMLEGGERTPTERAIVDICRIFGISREWLLEGQGDMRGDEQNFIAAVVDSMGIIDPEEREFLISYFRLPEEHRKAFVRFLDGLLEQQKKK